MNANTYKVMIVEDDDAIRDELKIVLENNDYHVVAPHHLEKIIEIIGEEKPHLILLDVNLPYQDGFEICSKVRLSSAVPIIFVTSRNTDMDELMSISIGGDDFITKPYNTPILLARIKALLKRAYPNNTKGETMEHKGLILNLPTSKISFKNVDLELTKNELKILHYLFMHKEKIVSRNDIIEYLWDHEMFVDDNTLSVNVTRIRNKLTQLGIDDFIKTKRGQGYLI